MIHHAIRCKRPAPTLRLSWAGRPELHCPACGRTCPADVQGDAEPRGLTMTDPMQGPQHDRPHATHDTREATA